MTVRDKVRLVAVNVIPVALLVTLVVLARPMGTFDVRMVAIWSYILGAVHGAMVAATLLGLRGRKPENSGSLME